MAFKVLISAYACNPYQGSEEGVGWGWVQAASKKNELWVLTAHYHRPDHEKAKREFPDQFDNLTFVYVPQRPWHYRLTPVWQYIESSMFKPIMNTAYRLWQRDAYVVAKNLEKEVTFDLVHQITYVGFRFPGHLWKLDIPFVWGPIGGLENTPWRFLPQLGVGGCLYYAGRNLINTFDKRYLPGPKKAFKKGSGGIVAATNSIQKEILRHYAVDSKIICETGPVQETTHEHSLREPGELLKLTWSGQHLPGKALPLLLSALSRLLTKIDFQFDILGAGSCTQKWRRLAKKLRIDQQCRWHGQVPRSEAIEIVHHSHLFAITSLKDLTSSVLLEALSQGVPVICPDHCGFADVVTGECGIKIAVHTPRQFVADLTSAIELLAKDEKKRRNLAKGALRRIEDFSWEKKARQVDLIYRRILNN